jgi:SpoVK/Ycf46/Vps4 family AAA+-type ATPase
MWNIDSKKAMEFIETTYKNEIVNKHHKDYYSRKKKKLVNENVIYLLNDKILIDIDDCNSLCILFPNDLEEKANRFVDKFKSMVKKSRVTKHISILVEDNGLRLMDIENKKPKYILSENYNDDLVELHSKIVKTLNKKNESGLFLFHGTPGTGKSTYIRYLIGCIKKRVIFLSPMIAGNLSSPHFMKIILENSNSVLVIEDAEDLLASRETDNNSAISLLLNLTDGLLGESLGIQVICTFNTHLSQIDKALLRKGRLSALYKFDPLAISKSKTLLEKIGIKNYSVNSSMTLADIYNTKEQNFIIDSGQKNAIGFKPSIQELV